MEISPDISEWDELSNENETPAIPDHVNQNGSPESKRQKTDEEAAHVENLKTPEAMDKTFAPTIEVTQVRSLSGQKWESEHLKAPHADKRIEEAYRYLKQIAACKLQKPKAEKDESQLFCDLLCLKLRALDEDTRERAMLEINNLMFHFKRDNASNIPCSPHPYYQQPGYYPGYGPQWSSGPYQQMPVYGHPQNFVPQPPPTHTRTAQKTATSQRTTTVQRTATTQKTANVQRTATTQKTTTTQTPNTSQPGLCRGAPPPLVEMAMLRPPYPTNYFY